MKRIVLVLMVIVPLAKFSYGQKKDSQAWKSETRLDQQYRVFKDNLNFWNGNYFMSGQRLDEFYGAVSDSIGQLESRVSQGIEKIENQKRELAAKQAQIDETQVKLDESIRNQNSISVLGANINKTVYSTVMYLFILGVLALSAVVFLMFRRGQKVTRQTKKEYEELKAEYEEHKKTSLDRYTKINMELHKTRLELQKK